MNASDSFDPFSARFEYRIVAAMLREADLYPKSPDVWEADYFRHRDIKRILACYRELRKPDAPAPDEVTLAAKLGLDFRNSLPESQFEDLLGLLHFLFTDDGLYPCPGFDAGLFRDHARAVAVVEAVDTGVALIQQRRFAEVLAHIAKATKVGEGLDENPLGPKISFSDLYGKKPDPTEALLGEEYLCRGGSMMLVGPSGQGKSSAAMQMGLSWALGYAAFGIVPARPLKILFIQSEDNLGDNMRMATGIAENAPGWPRRPLNSPETNLTLDSNFDLRTSKKLFGEPFFPAIRRQFEKEGPPDLLILNPFTAFLGGDPKNVKELLEFLRRDIGALQEDFGVAVLLVCHTPKTNYRDTANWKAVDWIYAAAGGAELSNWVRGIITLDPATADGTVHGFRAAKRGRAIGWGGPDQVHYFAHHPRAIAWLEATEEQVDRAVGESKLKGDHRAPRVEEVLELFKTGRVYSKTELVETLMGEYRYPKEAARKVITDLVSEGKLTETRVPGKTGGTALVYELGVKA